MRDGGVRRVRTCTARPPRDVPGDGDDIETERDGVAVVTFSKRIFTVWDGVACEWRERG